MKTYLLQISFGHNVELMFYATEDKLIDIQAKLHIGEKFIVHFPNDEDIQINPDFVQFIHKKSTTIDNPNIIKDLEEYGVSLGVFDPSRIIVLPEFIRPEDKIFIQEINMDKENGERKTSYVNWIILGVLGFLALIIFNVVSK